MGFWADYRLSWCKWVGEQVGFLTFQETMVLADWWLVWNHGILDDFPWNSWEIFIIPTDELHLFSEGWLNHQPGSKLRVFAVRFGVVSKPWWLERAKFSLSNCIFFLWYTVYGIITSFSDTSISVGSGSLHGLISPLRGLSAKSHWISNTSPLLSHNFCPFLTMIHQIFPCFFFHFCSHFFFLTLPETYQKQVFPLARYSGHDESMAGSAVPRPRRVRDRGSEIRNGPYVSEGWKNKTRAKRLTGWWLIVVNSGFHSGFHRL